MSLPWLLVQFAVCAFLAHPWEQDLNPIHLVSRPVNSEVAPTFACLQNQELRMPTIGTPARGATARAQQPQVHQWGKPNPTPLMRPLSSSRTASVAGPSATASPTKGGRFRAWAIHAATGSWA